MRRVLFFTAAGLITLAWTGIHAVGQSPNRGQSQRVLVLYSDERLVPANIDIDEAIHATFFANNSERIELYSEFLDAARFPGDEQRQRQRVSSSVRCLASNSPNASQPRADTFLSSSSPLTTTPKLAQKPKPWVAWPISVRLLPVPKCLKSFGG